MRLRDLELVDASVPETASFLDAARALAEADLSAVAVVDARRCVAGLFTEDDYLAGLFPRYLKELRHTAFAPDDLGSVAERARDVAGEPVRQHMRAPVVLGAETSAVHAAEVFLHCEWGALAVVDEEERYVGMIAQRELCRRLLPTLGT